MWTSFAWLLAFSVATLASWASAQERFEPQVYRDWAESADGQPCETQLEGYYSGSSGTNFVYPQAAFASRTSGDVLLSFDTSYNDGAISIVNARVFASSPSGVFDEAAVEIAQQFHFPAQMRNCQGIRAILWFRVNDANRDRVMRGFATGAYAWPPLRPDTTRILREGRLRDHCQIEGGAINPEQLGWALQRLYPPRAQERDRDGWGVVQFSIAADGSVVDPVMIEESPGLWGFGAAAVEAIKVARYPARAAACENAATTVRFMLRD